MAISLCTLRREPGIAEAEAQPLTVGVLKLSEHLANHSRNSYDNSGYLHIIRGCLEISLPPSLIPDVPFIRVLIP